MRDLILYLVQTRRQRASVFDIFQEGFLVEKGGNAVPSDISFTAGNKFSKKWESVSREM